MVFNKRNEMIKNKSIVMWKIFYNVSIPLWNKTKNIENEIGNIIIYEIELIIHDVINDMD